MATKHAVLRLDSMAGTLNGAYLKSAMIYDKFGDGAKVAAIDNAQLVILGEMEGREVYKATAPAASSTKNDVYLVGAPELFYDECTHHYLTEWENEAGVPVRVYKLELGADAFSATAEAFSGTPAVGKYVGFSAATKTKLLVQDSADNTTIGQIKAKENAGWGQGKYEYFYIQTLA